MYERFKVVVITPCGRRRYASLLAQHVQLARPVVDAHHLWVNPTNDEDARWIDELVASDPDFYAPVTSPAPPSTNPFERLMSFYDNYRDEQNTVYIRFDDDIVWLAPDAVEQLLRFRVQNPDFFLVYANTVNNGLCTHLHQRFGLLPSEPPMEYSAWAKQSWRRWRTAAEAHDALLSAIKRDSWTRFCFDRWVFNHGDYCSINAISWWGRDWSTINSLLAQDEERTLSCTVPEKTGRINCIAGDALVSHFAYYTQREGLERRRPDLLRQYAELL